MINNSNNKNIDPRLEKLLKEELKKRAEKIEAMKEWQDSEDKQTNGNSRLKIIYAAVSGLAAMFVLGFFLIQNFLVYSPNPEPSGEPIYRGPMVNPAIYEAVDRGDTDHAMHMIDSAIQVCKSHLMQLDSVAIISESQEEIQEMKRQTEQELNELIELKGNIRKK